MRKIKFIFLALFLSGTLVAQEIKKDTLSKIQDKKISFAIYPALGYTPETDFQFGFVAFLVLKDLSKEGAEFYRPTSISPYFLYTLNNQTLTAFDIDYYFKNGTNLNTDVRYYNYPDFFYGLGNMNEPEDAEQYTNEYWRLGGRILKPIDGKWFAGIRYNFQHNAIYSFEEGGKLDMDNYIGEDGGWSNGLGLALLKDTRDNTLYPTKGAMTRIELNFFSKVFGSDYSYTNYLLDVRRYWKIKNEKNVFAWQAYFNLTSGTNIPFYNLPDIAGDDKLRGIENASIYVDRQALYTQVEYRRHLFWRFGAVAFAGIGDVAYEPGDFDVSEFKYVAGVGGRFQALKDEKFNIRLDIGISRYGQSAFYLSIREAF